MDLRGHQRLHPRPKKAVPGTIMAFAGVAQAEERADILAYLRSLSDSPAPLPAAQ